MDAEAREQRRALDQDLQGARGGASKRSDELVAEVPTKRSTSRVVRRSLLGRGAKSRETPERSESAELADVERIRGTAEHASVASRVAVGEDDRGSGVSATVDPFVQSTHLLGTAAVLPEVAAGESAARIDRESSAETAVRLQLFGHDVDVELRRGRDQHDVVSL